ncbi:unnamed protein product, partial [Mesorhabditis spiculigera]
MLNDIIAFFAICLITRQIADPAPPHVGTQVPSAYYELNRTAVTAYWHNVLMRSLIKSKLEREKKYLNRIEAALADICLSEAKTLVDRLRCLDTAISQRSAKDFTYENVCDKIPREAYVREEKPILIEPAPPPIAFGTVKFTMKRRSRTRKKTKTFRIKKRRKSRRRLELLQNRAKQLQKEQKLSKFVHYLKSFKTERSWRRKREITAKQLKDMPEDYTNFGKDIYAMIFEIEEHERKVERINNFWSMVTKENAKLIQNANKNIDVIAPKLSSKRRLLEGALARVQPLFHKQQSKNRKTMPTSVLSPRFFSSSASDYADVLSPNIFGLRPGGILSLYDLGQHGRGAFDLSMTKFLLEISGSAKAIRHIYADMGPEIRRIKEEVYPDTMELAEHTLNGLKARRMMDNRQQCELKHYGYTHLSTKQIQLIYNKNNKFSRELPLNLTAWDDMRWEDKEQRLERMLWNMLSLATNHLQPPAPQQGAFVTEKPIGPEPPSPIFRRKRESPEEGPPGSTTRVNGILYEVLEPYSFDVLSGLDAYLEALVLSPSAFTVEIFQPELLILGLLSPRAFNAVILSPGALIARILSPMGFKVEVLSPRALGAWVLAPEGFVADILTPTFLEPRVLSPIGGIVSVLSPNILGPHIGGTDNLGITVLSPNILSPRIAGRERLLVEILSPHILGGEHLHAHHRGGHEPEEDDDEPAKGGHASIELIDLHGLAHDVGPDDPITLEKIIGRGEEWAEEEVMPDDRHLMEFLGIPLPPSHAEAHLSHLGGRGRGRPWPCSCGRASRLTRFLVESNVQVP